jgi:phospholipid/cholesterol/gamma-HCH transport system substrate-binding protein
MKGILAKVGVFVVAMLLVSAGLIVIFGEFRFAPTNRYHATFLDASRLEGGNDVRIAGVPVGTVEAVKLNPDNTVDVEFTLDKKYQLYTSTRAVIRYENLVGDRFMEITSGPGELKKLPKGSTISKENTQPALDLDALRSTKASTSFRSSSPDSPRAGIRSPERFRHSHRPKRI